MQALLGIFLAIVNFFLQRSVSNRQKELVDSGKALQFRETVEAENEIIKDVQAGQNSLTDDDVDQLLKKPGDRSGKHAVSNNDSRLPQGYERPDER